MPKLDHTVMMEMLQRGGLRNGYRGMLLVCMWTVCERELGHRPTQQEYSDWWLQSLASTTRQFRYFRKSVPEGVEPWDLAQSLSPATAAVDFTDRTKAIAALMGALGAMEWTSVTP
jgi:hypothetical protein